MQKNFYGAIAGVMMMGVGVLVNGAEQPRGATVEKQPFPPAAARQIDVNIPLAHHAIDALPEQAGFARIYSLDSKLGPPDRWRRMLAADNVDTSPYQYIAPAIDADAVLIGLFNGRIVRLGFFYPHLSDSKASSILGQFKAAASAFDYDEDKQRFLATIGGVRFVGELTGSHTWNSSSPGAISLSGSGPEQNHQHSFPVLLDVGIDEVDWYVTHHTGISPSVAAAMRARRLALGMTVDEANLAMGADGKLVGEAPGVQTFEWIRSHEEDLPNEQPEGTFGGTQAEVQGMYGGPGTPVHSYTVTDSVTQAIFRDGKLFSMGTSGQ